MGSRAEQHHFSLSFSLSLSLSVSLSCMYVSFSCVFDLQFQTVQTKMQCNAITADCSSFGLLINMVTFSTPYLHCFPETCSTLLCKGGRSVP
jgi:hypothetical protein